MNNDLYISRHLKKIYIAFSLLHSICFVVFLYVIATAILYLSIGNCETINSIVVIIKIIIVIIIIK